MLGESILNGRVVQGTADNALATASVAAAKGVRHFLAGIIVSFSAAPAAAYKTLQVKFDANVVADFTFDPLKDPLVVIPFPCPIHTDYNQALSVELGASGTAGVIGQLKAFVFSE